MSTPNAIIEHLRAKTEELGIDGAATYFYAGIGKKLTPERLQAVIAGEEFPTPRMCLLIVQTLDGQLADAHMNLLTTQQTLESALDRVSNCSERIYSLEAELRVAKNQPVLTLPTPEQGFVRPDRPVGVPVVEQPWMPRRV